MRIAFVIQRYGLDVHGGSEYLCRVWAERLARRHTVAVLTTCARDYLTWADHYSPGHELINGVQVQRYRVPEPRDMASFDAFSRLIYWQPHTIAQEVEWMRRGGPWSPALFAAIEQQQDEFDLFVFMTYLYCTTFFGMPAVAHKAVLVPTAHDEPPIYLGIFRQVFTSPRSIIYLTPAERVFVQRQFAVAAIPNAEIGIGIDLPDLSEHIEAEPPMLLYIGRIHPSKGCDHLHAYMLRYLAERSTALALVYAGRADMELAPHRQITFAGFVSEEEKQRLLAQCSVLVIPSPYESLSIVTLEAWAAGKPVLANGAAPVLREQVIRSNGGLFYTSYAEFAACLDLLLADAALRRQMGQAGRHFVERLYSWPAIDERLERALEESRTYVAACH
ncbi:MAG: glycosyltransferase family 4 protein [Chloroflexaceae bacterium]|nr:glycosyltransferase family 4 protein [Chloroflexaceae bacterium]NJO04907.1 glycosyltransferase family 4 protein [Chloroflexaceae bacterium]